MPKTDSRAEFLKVYANTPLVDRDNVLLNLEKRGPISWNAAWLEVKENTVLGEMILCKLDFPNKKIYEIERKDDNDTIDDVNLGGGGLKYENKSKSGEWEEYWITCVDKEEVLNKIGKTTDGLPLHADVNYGILFTLLDIRDILNKK